MREIFKTLKELWAIKRLRSLIILCLWLCFIGFVVALLRNNNNSSSNTTLLYKDYDNYEVSYTIGDIVIDGVTYNGESYLYIDSKRYVYMNDELSINGEVIEPLFNDVNFVLLQPKNLNNLLEQAIYDSKVTYTNSVKYNYVVSSEVYSTYMQRLATSDNILLSVTKENDMVVEISFDDITISYDKIGQIVAFDS